QQRATPYAGARSRLARTPGSQRPLARGDRADRVAREGCRAGEGTGRGAACEHALRRGAAGRLGTNARVGRGGRRRVRRTFPAPSWRYPLLSERPAAQAVPWPCQPATRRVLRLALLRLL